MTDWQARMVTPAVDLVAPSFRRRLDLDDGEVTAAVLHVTSLGVHEATIDGVPVSAEVLSPGWSSYEWRLRYRTHDVTALVRDGAELEVRVGNGWWRGRLGFLGGRALYGDRLGLLAQLEVTYADGHVQVIGTDETWTAEPSDTVADDLYDGQTIDATRRDPVWNSQATAVVPLAFDPAVLTPATSPPVVRHETLCPERVWTSPSGRTLVDFGQNLVGWLRFTVQGPRGSEIRIRHAEVLEHDELGVRPLRDAQATDRFVLSGGLDTFEPTFTFHGFRYAEVSGWPDGVPLEVEAVVVHTDLARTGTFACSDDDLTRFHANVVWGLRGNAVDVPTDCPQRNERLGWTGDLAVFAASAAYLFDVEDFLADWLVDLDLEQSHADGRVPVVVPDVLKRMPPPPGVPPLDTAALWSDAAVWVPWALWEAYGDARVLARQWDSMCAHVRRAASMASDTGLWDAGFQFGDWLDPDAPPDQPWAAKADPGVVATACLYRSADLLAQAAAVLGRDGAEFAALAARTRAAFAAAYVGEDGTIRSDCTTVYTLAIVFGLLDDDTRAGVRLAELVRASGHHISTGFAGTPYVCEALARTGHLDDAYALLLQRECPSWLYPVTMGATTVWERWDSMLPDGSVNDGEMTSFNHYALGSVADWLHRTVAGLAPAEPGYAAVRFAPRPGGGLTWAEGALETRHGRVAIRWELAGDELVVDTVLPDGVRGTLSLPDGREVALSSGSARARCPAPPPAAPRPAAPGPA